jgi:hypothetical protein
MSCVFWAGKHVYLSGAERGCGVQLGGGITEKRQGRFAGANSMPQITGALKKAAYDPRVSGIYLKISPLSAGWAKLQEIRCASAGQYLL